MIKLLIIITYVLISSNAFSNSTNKNNENNSSKLNILILSFDSNLSVTLPYKQTISAQLADLLVEINFYSIAQIQNYTESEFAIKQMSDINAQVAFIIFPPEYGYIKIFIKKENHVEAIKRELNITDESSLNEAVAIIIRSTVITIIERRQAEFSFEKAQSEFDGLTSVDKDDQLERSPSESRQWKKMYVESGFSLELHAPDTTPSPGLMINFGWRILPGLHLGLGTVLFSTISNSYQNTKLILKRHPVYFDFKYLHSMNKFKLGGGMGLCLDYVTEKISTQNPNVELNSNGAELMSSLEFLLHMQLEIMSSWSLYLSLGASILLNRKGYALSFEEQNIMLIDAYLVHPISKMGIIFNFF